MPTASFRVAILPSADEDLQSVPFPFRRQFNQRLYKLKRDPRPEDARIVSGEIHLVRLDKWGLVYEIDDEKQVLTVLGIIELGL